MKLAAACFGIAGPVVDNHSHTTNIPWVVYGEVIAFDIPEAVRADAAVRQAYIGSAA